MIFIFILTILKAIAWLASDIFLILFLVVRFKASFGWWSPVDLSINHILNQAKRRARQLSFARSPQDISRHQSPSSLAGWYSGSPSMMYKACLLSVCVCGRLAAEGQQAYCVDNEAPCRWGQPGHLLLSCVCGKPQPCAVKALREQNVAWCSATAPHVVVGGDWDGVELWIGCAVLNHAKRRVGAIHLHRNAIIERLNKTTNIM